MTGVTVNLHPRWKNGLKISFPYDPSTVAAIKCVLGTNWHPKTQKEAGYWEAHGPEVLLDFPRFGIKIDYMSPEARELCEGFRQQVWDTLDCRMLPIDDEPFSYQKQGSKFLSAMPNSILGDDMGTGKSKQSLDASILLGAKNVLILCNKTATYNWQNEIRKWGIGLTYGILTGSPAERKAFWKRQPEIVITNYENILRADWPVEMEWDVFIADEATRFKNATSLTWKRVKTIATNSKATWPLTGTPLEKNIDELYNIMAAIRPAVLGNYSRYKEQHMITDPWSGKVTGIKELDLLRERIGPFVLRRTKAEVQKNLPPKIYQERVVVLSDEELEAYERFTDDFNNWLTEHGVSGGGDPMTQTIRMRQFTCTPAIFTDELGRGSKFEHLQEIVDEWDGQIVVFCFFKEVIKLLQAWLGSHPDAMIHGDVSAEDRFLRVEEFNAGNLGKVFLSTDAGNQAINLTGADLIVHYDQIFNAQKMKQREDRLHRIGQKKSVTVMHMLCEQTIDYGMYQLNKDEEQLFRDVIDGAEELMLKKLNAPRWKNMIRGGYGV